MYIYIFFIYIFIHILINFYVINYIKGARAVPRHLPSLVAVAIQKTIIINVCNNSSNIYIYIYTRKRGAKPPPHKYIYIKLYIVNPYV